MKLTTIFKRICFASGACALLCAPLLLFVERLGRSEAALHLIQFIATCLCLISGTAFLGRTYRSPFGWEQLAALAGVLVSALWVAIVLYAVLFLDFSSLDMDEGLREPLPNARL